eukprot:5390006-Alexandrium_andersonii.AAC.1
MEHKQKRAQQPGVAPEARAFATRDSPERSHLVVVAAVVDRARPLDRVQGVVSLGVLIVCWSACYCPCYCCAVAVAVRGAIGTDAVAAA